MTAFKRSGLVVALLLAVVTRTAMSTSALPSDRDRSTDGSAPAGNAICPSSGAVVFDALASRDCRIAYWKTEPLLISMAGYGATNPEPQLVILACRSAEFRATLEGFAQPAAVLVRAIDGAAVRQFLVDYWITTHKEMKALARHYDHFSFVGLYMERTALLRAWFMQAVGRDIDSRLTLHVVGTMHQGLEGKLTERQHNILGLPSRTPEETVTVIDAIRTEMAAVGRWLADTHDFAYPQELENVVRRVWDEHKESLTRR
jgi:hypothetical protein